ncbi:MAG TPA: hypothetical protein VN417_01615 [Candidatus Cryosericum sp.]|nr:hypothetical protein [Candidatus Cryosericum sp.]
MRFLRKWLIPIIAGVMLLCLIAAFFPLSAREETRAKDDLTQLMNTAFRRIEASQSAADPVVAAEQASLLSKARAVTRFLEHDDTLLATDALSALCSQLAIGQIDVANAEGTLIASSDATRIGLKLGAEAGFDWVMGAVEDPTAELLKTDENDRSILYCCLPRADIEGFVLLTSDDTAVDDALALSSVDALIVDLPYGGDLLFQAAPGGTDGFFTDSGALCLRKTADDVTLIAARQNSVVYSARNVALIAVAALLLCVMICVVSAYLLHIELITVVTNEETDTEPEEDTGSDEALPEELLPEEELFAAPRTRREKRRKRPETFAEELLEQQDQPEEETLEEHERAVENAPRQVGRRRQKPEDKEADQPGNDEDPFDKIVD